MDEKQQELDNIKQAIAFIESNTDHKTSINRAYLSELHTIVTQRLSPPPKGEGSNHPGARRPYNVSIGKAGHRPPDVAVLEEYLEKFILLRIIVSCAFIPMTTAMVVWDGC